MTRTSALKLSALLLSICSLATVSPQLAAEEKTIGQPCDQPKKSQKPIRLRMSKAVVCSSVDGYERFKILPGAAQTADEKLLIYYRPLYYKVVQKDDSFTAHLTQDGQVRRKGEKTVLFRKQKLLDYEAKGKDPLGPIFLRNSVSLKGLTPGEYEFDIILRDENEPGPPSLQSVKFRIVAAVQPEASGEAN